jgi:hypothetical protein
MNIVLTALLILAGIVAFVMILAVFMRKEHYVRREVIINASRQKVFDYLKLLKNQDNFNKNAMAGSERKREYRGTDGTVGYVYAWAGDKNSGEGEKEIISIVEGERIEMAIRFIKPMAVAASIIMEMENVSDGQTRVSWSNSGTLKIPVNVLIPFMERSVAKDMDASLLTLKAILEK